MKKMITMISVCLVAALLLSLLSSCGVKKKFVGSWELLNSDGEPEGTVLVLADDGTGSITQEGMSGSVTWSIEDDTLFLTISICGMSETQECTYKFSGDQMILTNADGDETVYRKKSK